MGLSSSRKPGTTINTDGYVRITAGPWRDKYQHRLVVHEQIIEQRRTAIAMLIQTDSALKDQFLGLLDHLEGRDETGRPRFALTADWEVHHIDGNRKHNCPGNLLRIDAGLHHALQGGKYPHEQRGRTGWRPKPKGKKRK